MPRSPKSYTPLVLGVAVVLGGSCPGGSGPGGCSSRIRFHATAKAKHHFLWIRSKQEVWYDFMNKLFEQINFKHYCLVVQNTAF